MATKSKTDSKSIEQVVGLMQNLLAIELWKGGVSQAEIGKRLGIATGSVNKIVKGINRPSI